MGLRCRVMEGFGCHCSGIEALVMREVDPRALVVCGMDWAGHWFHCNESRAQGCAAGKEAFYVIGAPHNRQQHIPPQLFEHRCSQHSHG